MFYNEGGTVLPERYYDRRDIGPGVYRMIVWENGMIIFDDIIDEENDVTVA